MSSHFDHAACAVALVCLLTGAGHAARAVSEPEKWRASTGLTFTSGDYGTDSNTTATYLPFGIDRLFSRGRLGLVMPWVSITTEGDVSLAGGVPHKGQGGKPPKPATEPER